MLTVVAVAALVGAGVAGGTLLHSPDETLAADVPPTVLTAPVESRVLQSEVTGTGTFTVAESVPVRVAAPDGMSAVVTGTPVVVGAGVGWWCRPVVEVSGRPVIALPGVLPTYRDLTVGDSGPDVRQLQAALRDCGHRVGVDGTFGPATAAAVTAMYRAAGTAAVTSAGDGLGGTDAAASTGPADGDAAGDEASVAPVSWHVTTTTPEPAADPDTAPAASGPPAPSASPAPSVVLPRGEVVYLPTEGRLTAVLPPGRAPGTDPVATVALAGDSFSLSLSATQRAQVTAGVPVTVTRDGWSVTVALLAADATATDASGGVVYPVTLPLPEPVDPTFYGQEGTFTAVVGSGDPYPLVVPVSALQQDTDGSTSVRVAVSDGSATGVPVTVTASAGGYSAVEPVRPGALEAGDEVVIGG